MRSFIALTIITLSLSAFAADKPPAQPSLPPGHPTLPAADNTQPVLPPGHPQLPANNGTPGLPAGHPQIPGNPGAAALPAGHPQVNPSSGLLPPGTKASLTIKAVQATKGGPAIGADPVSVEYYNADGEVIGRTAATLSDNGQTTIKDITLTVPVQPLITVTHAGVEYKAPGSVMEGTNREQEVAVNVFETTDREPAWQVRMRHVIVTPNRDGLDVTEMISVFNPTDRAWTGRRVAAGAPITLELVLPPTATNLRAGGAFRDNAVKLEEGKLLGSMPLVPGAADLQVHYHIPTIENDRAEVTLWAPAPTGSFYVFLPADGTVVTSNELKLVEAKAGARLRADSRFYTAPPQNAGDVIRFTVSGLKGLKKAAADMPADAAEAPAATNTGTPAAGIPKVAKVAGGVTAAAILTVGTAVILYKSPKAAGAKR
jgi:hypothetical protein